MFNVLGIIYHVLLKCFTKGLELANSLILVNYNGCMNDFWEQLYFTKSIKAHNQAILLNIFWEQNWEQPCKLMANIRK